MCSRHFQALVQALDLRACGGVRLAQFLAAASDRWCSNACTLLDKDPFPHSLQSGLVGVDSLAATLEQQSLGVQPASLLDMLHDAGISVHDGSVSLLNLEARFPHTHQSTLSAAQRSFKVASLTAFRQ